MVGEDPRVISFVGSYLGSRGGIIGIFTLFQNTNINGVVTLSYRGVDRQYWGTTCRRSTNKEDFFNTTMHLKCC